MLFEKATPTSAGYRDVSPAALSSASGKIHVVDVREAHELRDHLGHIRGVDHVPLATLPARVGAWRKDEEIVLVCRSGGRSGQAARILVAAGFQRVMNLAGGMLAYNAAGLPVARP
jgi:rhodanese-related sulfurtransferase